LASSASSTSSVTGVFSLDGGSPPLPPHTSIISAWKILEDLRKAWTRVLAGSSTDTQSSPHYPPLDKSWVGLGLGLGVDRRGAWEWWGVK
jgi:hypothetical protein